MYFNSGRVMVAAAILLAVNCIAGAAAQPAAPASTATFPVRPVRFIVPLAHGGGSDIVARILAAELTGVWAQSVIVDNRPGAGSTVGTAIAAKSIPDGYTLLVSSSSLAISPALYKTLDFDVKRDFSGITLIANQPSILAVHAAVQANTVSELIALAKAQPGKLTYASAGTGSATHLGAELLNYTAGIALMHVPYKSAGLATAALLSGEAQVLLTNMASVLPHLKSGRIKALAISAAKRSALAPELPTIAEGAIPGFEYSTWYAMLAPAKTPRSIINRIQGDIAALLRSPHARERFVSQGMEPHGTTASEIDAFLDREMARWGKVIHAAGIRAE
jgi:tripartite-type tricarboxylate transporter receptor subunit TctC